jgi:hypothetical protein
MYNCVIGTCHWDVSFDTFWCNETSYWDGHGGHLRTCIRRICVLTLLALLPLVHTSTAVCLTDFSTFSHYLPSGFSPFNRNTTIFSISFSSFQSFSGNINILVVMYPSTVLITNLIIVSSGSSASSPFF